MQIFPTANWFSLSFICQKNKLKYQSNVVIQVKVLNCIFGSITAIIVSLFSTRWAPQIRSEMTTAKKNPQNLNKNLSPTIPEWHLNHGIFTSKTGNSEMKLRLSAFPLWNTSHKNYYCTVFAFFYLLEFFYFSNKSQAEALKWAKTMWQY